jgi:diaminopimelate decarboxylase
MPLPIEPEGPFEAAGADAATRARPLCLPDDALGRPPLEVGDVIKLPNVGAYSATASLLLFLSRQVPREVVVRGGKIVTVSRLQVRRNVAGKGGFDRLP